MKKFVELVIMIAVIFLLLFEIGAAKASDVNLTYGQCWQYNDSNGSQMNVCTEAWRDLNVTDIRMNLTLNATAPYSYSNPIWNLSVEVAAPAVSPPTDCRLNLTVVGTAPYLYTNPSANVNIFIAAPKYNVNKTLDFAENWTHTDTNITCQGPQFPALNTYLNISDNFTYVPDSRYNLTVRALFEYNTSMCRDNIDNTLDFGGDYYSSKCNIHIRAPAYPTINETAVLAPGEVRQNAQLAFSYTCKDTSGEIAMCVAQQVLQNQSMAEMLKNETDLRSQLDTLNMSLAQQISLLRDRDENISVSTAMLTANNVGSEWVDKLVMAFGIIIGTIAGLVYIQHWYTKKKGPPSGETEEPLMVEVSRRTDEKLSKRFEELDKKYAQEKERLNKKFSDLAEAEEFEKKAKAARERVAKGD